MAAFKEANFDGLVGPSHNYAGLALGNTASLANSGARSNPQAAALQGLAKMKRLANLGLVQGFLPPQPRPCFKTLHRLGFRGSEAQAIEACAREAPGLLAAVYSASAMWTANAATVAPSSDAADGTVHFTPANLISHFHRSLEGPQTARTLRALFPEGALFSHHQGLPETQAFGDEGAANHTRLHAEGHPGAHLFVYGQDGARFRARQTEAASRAVARLHRLTASTCAFIPQSTEAIDAGAFHNDVVGVGDGDLYLYHEKSFEDPEAARAEILRVAPYAQLLCVPDESVPLADAITSYLFNSQLLTLPSGDKMLVLPNDVRENDRTRAYVDGLLASGGPVTEAMYFDLRESMRNGGGPACLRLRVALTEAELAAVTPAFLFSDETHRKLKGWVEKHYRDRLEAKDLADPALARACLEATDALQTLLGADGLYP